MLKRPTLSLLVAFGVLLLIGLLTNPPLYRVFEFAEPINDSFGAFAGRATDLNGLGLNEAVIWTVNYLLTMALGAALLRAVFPVALATPHLWLGGFWLGYLGVVSLSRLWSLFFSDWQFNFAVTLSIWAIVLWRLTWPARKSALIKNSMLAGAVWMPVFLAFLAPILIHQVYMGDFRWNGHGTGQYAIHTLEWHMGRMPILLQHYDEVLYHHFLVGSRAQTFDPVIPWWVTLGLMKLSSFAFFLIFFRGLGLSARTGRVASVFLFIGTLSILPGKYYLMSDSANPLAYTVHSGRLLGIPFAALFLLWLREKFIPPAWAQIVLGCALVLTPFSNFLWLPVLWLLHRLFSVEVSAALKQRALSGLAMIPAFYIYPSKVTAWLNLFILSWNVKMVWQTLKLGRPIVTLLSTLKAWPLKPMAWSMTATALLLGNMFAGLPPGKLFARLFQLEQVSLQQGAFHLANLGRILKDHRELEGIFNIYNRNPFTTLTVYGLLFWLACVALIATPNAKTTAQAQRWLCALCIALPGTFFLVDFVGLSRRSWFLSRFFEIPIYLTALCALAVVLEDKVWRKYAPAMLGLYCLVPLMATQRFQQIAANFDLLRSLWLSSTP